MAKGHYTSMNSSQLLGTMLTTATILRVAVPSPLPQCFDYRTNDSDTRWTPGMRVRVPFGRRHVVGVVMDVVTETDVPSEKLKTIDDVVDDFPCIPSAVLKLCQWASDYYHHAIGEVVSSAVPKLIRQGRVVDIKEEAWKDFSVNENELTLTAEQENALKHITREVGFQCFVLAGVTGSGKTEVYLQAIEKVLREGRQALVLIPEISLTPQTVARFTKRFNVPITVLHSRLTDKKRLDAWLQARRGGSAIVIGTRSAIFTPLDKLGIIILDEEHDNSFKQNSGFRYSARDLAIVRAQMLEIPVVLGSATPALETLYNVRRGRHQRLDLPQRATQSSSPDIQVIDMCQQSLVAGLCGQVITAMQKHLEKGNQVLLFLNRRGYAPVLLCHQCGWMAVCTHCDARLTVHFDPKRLQCHHCGSERIYPRICEHCQQGELLLLGQGTERLEQEISVRFPEYRTARIDRDTTQRKGSMDALLESIHKGESQILIGTQMLSKGHHFPNLTLVVIVDVDNALYSSDFRALERMAQLVLQVAGRAGREKESGEVLLQTHQPEHPLLNLLLQQGYDAFANAILSEREAAALPPFVHFALLRAEGKQRNQVMEWLERAKTALQAVQNVPINILGPVPALMERKAGRYRAQLLLQSDSRKPLKQVLKQLQDRLVKLKSMRTIRWSLDVDPQEM